jgi:hypothetical protein
MRYCEAFCVFANVQTHLPRDENPTRLDYSMTEPFAHRKPRFNVGDLVRTIGPSARQDQGNSGTVTEIHGSAENVIYRYRVTFTDGSSETFFGFELEPIAP